MTLFESLFPSRCYDCLAVCAFDKVLCASCERLYADEKNRRASDG